MKKTVVALSLLLISCSAFSQERNSKISYKTNGLWDNWFVNIGGGGSMFFGGEQRKEANLAERLTWGATASVGKWFTPIFGLRLTLQGGAKNTFNKNGIPILNNGIPINLNTISEDKIHHMAKDYYGSGHADVMINFSNLVAGYKENRVYNLIPYIGVGGATDRKNFKNKSVVAAVGLLNTFKISRNLAISLDISSQAVQSKFNEARFPKGINSYNQQDWDAIGSVNFGLTIGLGGKQNFDRTEAVTIIDNTDNLLIEDLNRQINDLTLDNERLRNQLETKIKTPEVQEIEKPIINNSNNPITLNAPNSIQFDINKFTISPTQEIIIYNVAEFLNNNLDTAVEIVGFADKQTGTAEINKVLSQKRARAVENRLINKYGISKNRIISSWKGDKVQPYPVNNWNRVVVITVVDSEK